MKIHSWNSQWCTTGPFILNSSQVHFRYISKETWNEEKKRLENLLFSDEESEITEKYSDSASVEPKPEDVEPEKVEARTEPIPDHILSKELIMQPIVPDEPIPDPIISEEPMPDAVAPLEPVDEPKNSVKIVEPPSDEPSDENSPGAALVGEHYEIQTSSSIKNEMAVLSEDLNKIEKSMELASAVDLKLTEIEDKLEIDTEEAQGFHEASLGDIEEKIETIKTVIEYVGIWSEKHIKFINDKL